MSEAIATGNAKFRKGSQKVLAFDAFISPYNFVTHLNRVFEGLGEQLDRLTFLFDNLVRERAKVVKADMVVKLDGQITAMEESLGGLDQKRLDTKEVQARFITTCEELLQLNTDALLPDSKIPKDVVNAKKMQKQVQEAQYRTSYVR